MNREEACLVLAHELRRFMEPFYGKPQEVIVKSINKSVLSKANKRRNELAVPKSSLKANREKFDSKEFSDYVTVKENPDPETIKFTSFSGLPTFMGGWSRGNTKTRDTYSMLIFNCGFKELLEREDIDADNVLKPVSSPMDEVVVSDFFKNGVRLFVYSEDMETVGKETRFLDLYYPKIDSLILKSVGGDKLALINLPSRIEHGLGKIEWISNGSKNSFQIVFPSSPRRLNLRFCLPNKQYLNNDMQILIGLFLITNEDTGKVQAGSVVLQRSQNNLNLEPYQYNPLARNNKDIDEALVIYLYDRYKNWIKSPGQKIYDFESLNDWFNDKEEKYYTRRRPIKNKFLVTFPITSLKDEDKSEEIEKTLKLCFRDFAGYNHLSDRIKRKVVVDKEIKSEDELIVKIDKYLKERFAQIYFSPSEMQEIEYMEHRKINTELFHQINQSLNVVFVVPGQKVLDYKNISSIYTIIGYCLALRRNTFILCESRNTLPLILKKSINEMKLNVWTYTNLKEIPFLFYYKMEKAKYD